MVWINNYEQQIALTAAATTAALSLPDGEYRLTLSDAGRTRWEIVDAAVAAGTASLTRAREGTAAQPWPAGSVVYCAVTAAQLNGLLQQVAGLQEQLAELTARVAALEAGGGTAGALTDSSGNVLTDAAGNTLTTGA